MNLLLVEDDSQLGVGLRMALVDEGFTVYWVTRISDAAREMETIAIDLVLLDLGLPDGDGLSLIQALRRERKTLPIFVITARDALEDRLAGLDLGADDYLVKPFALEELFSRIRALARRTFGFDGETIKLRNLQLVEGTMRVTLSSDVVELSKTEFEILSILLKRQDKVVTRGFLEDQIRTTVTDSNVLDVHISNLRKKIGEGFIRTVRGVGYVIDRKRDD
jgi:two-component system, OmpR family, response regulator QseB